MISGMPLGWLISAVMIDVVEDVVDEVEEVEAPSTWPGLGVLCYGCDVLAQGCQVFTECNSPQG